jgi:putative phosphoesterase
MLLGILSDTHGRFAAAKLAVQTLQQGGAQYLIHCGDVGREDILDLLVGVGEGAAFVFGNNDYDRDELARYAKSIGITCLGVFGTVELGGKRIAVTHGDHRRYVSEVLEEQAHDYLLLGHTHVPRDQRLGKIRVINPGALHRAVIRSVALLDLEKDRLELVELSHE